LNMPAWRLNGSGGTWTAGTRILGTYLFTEDPITELEEEEG